MIKAIKYEDIVKILAKVLDNNSGLDPKRILNADSVRGTDLSQYISSSETYAPDVSDSFLIFELLENQNGDHFVTKGEDDSMITIQSYDYHLMIYGNSSPTDAQKISAVFKKENIALSLRDEGIFVNGVTGVEAINEFINNTYILRRDLIIKIQTRYVFENKENIEYFDPNQNVDPVVKDISKINIS